MRQILIIAANNLKAAENLEFSGVSRYNRKMDLGELFCWRGRR